jgi:hypothetical protein
VLSSIKFARNARIAVGVGAGAAAGLSAAKFIGGLSSGALGNIAAAPPYDTDSVKFPSELFENDHYIEFTAKKTEGRAEGFASEIFGPGAKGNTVLGGSIYLPMPSQLSTDYNPDYSTPDLGPGAGMLLKPADQAIYGNDSMGMKSASGLSLAGLGGAVAGGIAAKTVSNIERVAGLVGGGAGAAGALLKVAGGVALNQHKIVLFTGVNFREHQFSWKLSPKNRKESDDIRKIIDMFAYYSHPEYIAGGLFFKYPEFFEIKFRHPEYLCKLQPSVCKDIKVNYHGQGYAAYIRDANGGGIPAPAEIELSLTFLETEIVTKQSLNGALKAPTPIPRPPLTGIGQNEVGPNGRFNGPLGTGSDTPTFLPGA